MCVFCFAARTQVVCQVCRRGLCDACVGVHPHRALVKIRPSEEATNA